MGSTLRLVVYGASHRDGVRAWQAVSEDVERTEATLSRFRDDSDLTRLNRDAGPAWQTVDARLYAMLATAHRAQGLTGGRFDPRVLGRLEAMGEHGAPLPHPSDATSVMETTEWLEREPSTRRARIAVPIDSGGIGKGLALRWAARALRRARISADGVLIEAGGDLVVEGRGPDGLWRIGVEEPADLAAQAAVLETAGGAVATSSIAVRQWTAPNGEWVHHLIDPTTGQPGGGGLQAVTVLGPDPAWAEVWSKALFLAGPSAIGLEARRNGLAAWWFEADDTLHMTPAARQRTVWTRQEGHL